jgi:hypothetical protein
MVHRCATLEYTDFRTGLRVELALVVVAGAQSMFLTA